MAEFYVGTQGFSAAGWAGSFYPPGLADNERLAFYARVFNSVEFNVTFYTIPSAAPLRAWMQRTPPEFVFAAKMWRAITHDKRLVDVQQELDAFLTAMRRLENRLGPIIIQFPPSFDRRAEPELRAFLTLLPGDLRFAVELRDASWHDDAIFDLLREHHIAWCINDWENLPPVVAATTDLVYLRLIGFHREFDDLSHEQRDRTAQLERWSRDLHALSMRVQRIFVYINNHYTGYAPDAVNRLKALLGLPQVDPRSLWAEQDRLL